MLTGSGDPDTVPCSNYKKHFHVFQNKGVLMAKECSSTMLCVYRLNELES